MSLLSRLFKTKQPETLEQKLSNLEAMDEQQLIACLNSDESETYRCAAVAKLSYSSELLQLAANHETDPQLKTAARKRLGELLDLGTVTVATLGAAVADQQQLVHICSYSQSAGQALVETIDQQELLLDVASGGATTHIRQAAAQKIHSRELLEGLAKQAKNKDKSVYKIVKAKLDVFKEQQARTAEKAQAAQTLCAQAEQLGKRPVDEVFHARRAQIEKAWSELASDVPAAIQERYQNALQRCNNKIEELEAQEKYRTELEEAAKEAKKHVYALFGAWQRTIADLLAQPVDESSAPNLQQLQEQQERVIQEATAQGLDITDEPRQLKRLQQSANDLLEKRISYGSIEQLAEALRASSSEAGAEIKKRLQQLLKHADDLTDIPAPAAVDEARAAVKQWQDDVSQRAHQAKQQLRAVADLVRRGEWAVSQGHMGRARAILRDLEEAAATVGELPNNLAAKLGDFKTSIHKLGDWHDFAVTPKKEALVEQMQSLVHSPLPPPQRADKIHKLQEQWKELCRGGQNQDEQLWQQFHQASQEAYEPCKSYFEQQTQQREQNAEQRKTLLNQLAEYENAYDWASADWKEVEKTLRLAREAWQSFWPVPRKDTKTLQGQFDQLMDRLYGKVKEEHERNRLRKEDVVAQAEKLIQLDDIPQAIEAAKKLQSQWQTIGQCKRKDDQALWKQFRAHCDAIFEKRNQENEALKEEREQTKQQAEQLLNKLEAYMSLEGEAYLNARPEVDQTSTDFKHLGELPRADSKALFERYNNIMELLQAKTQRERRVLGEQTWRSIFAIADRLRQLELLQTTGEDAVAKLPKVQELFAEVGKWPGDTRQVLEQRQEQLAQLSPDDIAGAEQQLRVLCIRAEIINGLETPGEDKNLRMQHQVELMQNEGLGQTAAPQEHVRQQLLEQWLGQPGGTDAAYATLLRRFADAWDMQLS